MRAVQEVMWSASSAQLSQLSDVIWVFDVQSSVCSEGRLLTSRLVMGLWPHSSVLSALHPLTLSDVSDRCLQESVKSLVQPAQFSVFSFGL